MVSYSAPMKAPFRQTRWRSRTRSGRRPPRRDRAPRGAFLVASGPLVRPPMQPVLDLRRSALAWPGFWSVVQRHLRQAGFRRGTLCVYRQVLRGLRRHLELCHGEDSALSQPGALTSAAAHDYLCGLSNRRASWSWQSINISVLRTAFDKLGGLSTTVDLNTPKRPMHLAEVVSEQDVGRMLAVSATIRDRLLMGLLYGCGLKVGEACQLRWADLDATGREVTVNFAGNTRQRTVEVPEALRPVLAAGRARCAPDTYVFAGAKGAHTHLSTRMAQRIVRRAALEAAIEKPVCCMTLRHSYAVFMRRQGANVRQVQETLGHRRIQTTLRYDLYTPPAGVVSPVDRPPFVAVSTATPPPTAPIPPYPDLRLPPADLLPPPLPFAQVGDGAPEFQAQLKTRIGDRFLAPKGAALSTG